MTTDRDRVEAACRRRFPSWDDPQAWSEGARRNMRLEVADFIGAADALAPPAVPEDVRKARASFELDRHRIVALLTDLKGAFDAVAATPAPPADTGDEDATAIRRLEQVLDDERIAAHGLEAERDTLTRRVRELEQALRPFAIRMPPDRRDDDFYRPLEPFSLVGDHRRASAILGGGNV
jgi:hypothetical protein